MHIDNLIMNASFTWDMIFQNIDTDHCYIYICHTSEKTKYVFVIKMAL